MECWPALPWLDFSSMCMDMKVPVSPQEQAHLRLLKLLNDKPGLSQRQLAEELGVSLGKTHYLLQALIAKGFLKVDNFRHSPHKMRYFYLLTPAGLEAKLRLTRDYLARKEAEYQALRAEIEHLRTELQAPPSEAGASIGGEGVS